MSLDEGVDLRRRLDQPPVVPFRYLPALDGIRGTGILIVMFGHFAAGTSEWAKGRFFGVSLTIDLFFVLSGFLITSLLLEEWSKTSRISMRNFYVRRGLRLLPALALLLVFVGVITVTTDWLPLKRTIAEILLATFYLYPVALVKWQGGAFLLHLWTLSVEEWFYFVWPALLAIVGLKPGTSARFRLVIGTLVALVAGCFALRRIGSFDVGSRLVYALRPDALALGALLAMFVRKLPDIRTPRLDTALKIAGPAGVAGYLWFAWFATFPRTDGWSEEVFHDHSFRSWNFQLGIFSVMLLVMHAIIHPESRFARFLSWKPWVWLGSLSYALYLWHQVLFRLWAEHIHLIADSASLAVKWATGLGVLAATVAVSMLSRRYVELPALKLKHRFETVHHDQKS